MSRIAVLTSGGDAPGMNAAIRAVVRAALAAGDEVVGVRDGFTGLVEDRVVPLEARSVGGIIDRGGTVLGSSRCGAFLEAAGRERALGVLGRHGADALVVIGGNGSQAGAAALAALGFPVVGVASTIDNDLPGSEMTIGVDTALNIALEALDRIRVTAGSHHRAFLVEVMGRDCGYLALMTGLAGGAEAVVIPEVETDPEALAAELRDAYARGKAHAVVVVAEGARANAAALVAYFRTNRARLGFELRATILGHVQRGGVPTAFDRLLATRLGVEAVACLGRGEAGVLVGLIDGRPAATPLAEVAGRTKAPDLGLLDLVRLLAR